MFDIIDEIYFWTGIMRDHAEFQITSLSVREADALRTAEFFKNSFSLLHEQAKGLMDIQPYPYKLQMENMAKKLVSDFIVFKRLILKRLLTCDIEISLPPTFINHMINEALDFFRVLCTGGMTGMDKTAENIYLHKIWLPDASGHAAAISAELDPTEAQLIMEADEFKKLFDSLFIKAVEIGTMLERACLDNGSLSWLNEEADKKISLFIEFLKKVRKLRMKCRAMGFVKPLVPDHMIREEEYYLSKLRGITTACTN